MTLMMIMLLIILMKVDDDGNEDDDDGDHGCYPPHAIVRGYYLKRNTYHRQIDCKVQARYMR